MSTHPDSTRGTGSRANALIIIDHRRPDAAIAPLLEQVAGAARRHDRIVVWSDRPGDAARRGPARRRDGLTFSAHPAAGWLAALQALAAGHDGPLCIVDDSARPTGGRWLEDLLDPLQRGEADATAPATNAAPYPSCPLDAPDAEATAEEIRRTAQACRTATARRTLDALHGPVACISSTAVRTAMPGARSLAELTLTDAVVVELPRVYVHAVAGVPRLSACLIVKDEAAELADCLATLRPLVDEVVVYDTGSSDDTVALARSLGATVIEGEWRIDFSWARNQALAAARGTWVLSIDADERLELDHGVVAEVRGLLDDDPPIDRFVIDLFDLQGSVHAPVRSNAAVPMARLFRRRACHWVGALHEQPDARPGRPAVRSINLPGLRFLHRGYLNEAIAGRNKWARNLEVATAGLDRVPDSDKDCFDLARSLHSVGEHQRAFVLFERAAELGQNLVITRGALEFAVLSLLEAGLATEADPYLERLRVLEGGAAPARYLQGWVHVHRQRWDDAVACFEGITGYDDNFTGFRAESVSLALCLAYRALGRSEDAVAAAVETLRCNDQALEAWAVLFDCAEPGSAAELHVARAIAPERLVPLMARLQPFAPPERDRLIEAVWQVHPGERIALAVASQLAPSLAVERQVVWSGRLRAHGLGALCPLRALADDGTRTVAERAAALAAGLANPGGEDLEEPLERLAALLLDDELVALVDRCLDEGIAALGPIIVGSATTAARCLAVVRSLDAHGLTVEALPVLAHGADLDAAETRRLLDRAPQLDAALRRAARAAGRLDLATVLPDAA